MRHYACKQVFGVFLAFYKLFIVEVNMQSTLALFLRTSWVVFGLLLGNFLDRAPLTRVFLNKLSNLHAHRLILAVADHLLGLEE
jgi:hypothetical protein